MNMAERSQGAGIPVGNMVLDNDVIRGIGNGADDRKDDPEHDASDTRFFTIQFRFHTPRRGAGFGGTGYTLKIP